MAIFTIKIMIYEDLSKDDLRSKSQKGGRWEKKGILKKLKSNENMHRWGDWVKI